MSTREGTRAIEGQYIVSITGYGGNIEKIKGAYGHDKVEGYKIKVTGSTSVVNL
jgi:hypothetical protein